MTRLKAAQDRTRAAGISVLAAFFLFTLAGAGVDCVQRHRAMVYAVFDGARTDAPASALSRLPAGRAQSPSESPQTSGSPVRMSERDFRCSNPCSNGSGKSTFLDVVAFLGDMLRAGPGGAVQGDLRLGIPERAPDARHLVWMQTGDRFELAVELAIPDDRKAILPTTEHTHCRYVVGIAASDEMGLFSETLYLKPKSDRLIRRPGPALFPSSIQPPESLDLAPRKHLPTGWKKVVSRGEDPANVTFSAETSGWTHPFRLGPNRCALANLPEDETKFPVGTWVKQLLTEGVHRIALASEAMRRPSPPGRVNGYPTDGSALPRLVHRLEEHHPERLLAWVRHLKEAVPDLASVETKERPEDRSRYLVLKYTSGRETPSWLVPDGVLRLLALTSLAYVPDLTGVHLIEEPENGIHPRAVELVFQSLSSVYGGQVLCATHSPVVVAIARPGQILCFARDENGATDVVPGSEHPRLKTWKGEVDLGTLFAGGVLG